MNIYLCNYNSYFDRTIKRENDIQSYLNAGAVVASFSDVNFKPNDGINTELIVNTNVTANYLLTQEVDSLGEESVTRWFIMEQTRTRNGQYRLTLKRDVVADWYDEVIEAPTFIEKATVPNDNPLIFNSEGMTFNEIKTEETLLKDDTKCGWIVGFMANNYEGGEINGTYHKDADIVVDSLSNWEFAKFRNKTMLQYKPSMKYGVTYTLHDGAGNVRPYGEEAITNGYAIISILRTSYFPTNTYRGVDEDDVGGISEAIRNAGLLYPALNYLESKNANYYGNSYYYMPQFNGKVIYESNTGLYYQVKVIDQGEDELEYAVGSDAGELYVNLKNALDVVFANRLGGQFGSQTVKLHSPVKKYRIEINQVANVTGSFSLNMPSEYTHLKDAPYSMFCIPYIKDESIFIKTPDNLDVYMNEFKALGIANAIANALQPASSGGFLYDLQLLPFCPIEGFAPYGEMPGINMLGMTSTEYTEAKDGSTTIGYIYWVGRSSFDLTINHTIQVNEPKISKECEKYRLVSPNHASISEFSPAMNGGVNHFHIACTYKPFTPYINVHIGYSNLYGRDFDDSRGLICGGDYSLPIMSDAWQSYQIQNKNYAAIFDREIENMEVNNKIQMVNQVGGAIAGTAQGALTGAMAGGVAGAVVGGVASAVGGIADTAMLGIQQAEAKNFKTDMYNYNLGNIQAKPQGLAKSSGFDINNKIWPYLEYYTCTDIEKEAFREKLRYNGMTVGVIGKIRDYLWPTPTFVKGQIIRLGLADDTHLANTIYEEISKGVYI